VAYASRIFSILFFRYFLRPVRKRPFPRCACSCEKASWLPRGVRSSRTALQEAAASRAAAPRGSAFSSVFSVFLRVGVFGHWALALLWPLARRSVADSAGNYKILGTVNHKESFLQVNMHLWYRTSKVIFNQTVGGLYARFRSSKNLMLEFCPQENMDDLDLVQPSPMSADSRRSASIDPRRSPPKFEDHRWRRSE